MQTQRLDRRTKGRYGRGVQPDQACERHPNSVCCNVAGGVDVIARDLDVISQVRAVAERYQHKRLHKRHRPEKRRVSDGGRYAGGGKRDLGRYEAHLCRLTAVDVRDRVVLLRGNQWRRNLLDARDQQINLAVGAGRHDVEDLLEFIEGKHQSDTFSKVVLSGAAHVRRWLRVIVPDCWIAVILCRRSYG